MTLAHIFYQQKNKNKLFTVSSAKVCNEKNVENILYRLCSMVNGLLKVRENKIYNFGINLIIKAIVIH